MKIATWNINSIRARLPILTKWLDEARPDVLCLQEIKCQEFQFPKEIFDERGYNLLVVGQKSYNGVAIASLTPLEDTITNLPLADVASSANSATDMPLFSDTASTASAANPVSAQSRYVEAVTSFGDRVIRICCCYMPNGHPVGSEKFDYKIEWMKHLTRHVSTLVKNEEPLVVLGDANIIPNPDDAANIEKWAGGCLHHPKSLEQYRKLLKTGLLDPARSFAAAKNSYSYWDYQAGARDRNDGIRIDHILLSPEAADCCADFGTDDWVRDLPRPSDHVPVWVKLQDDFN